MCAQIEQLCRNDTRLLLYDWIINKFYDDGAYTYVQMRFLYTYSNTVSAIDMATIEFFDGQTIKRNLKHVQKKKPQILIIFLTFRQMLTNKAYQLRSTIS